MRWQPGTQNPDVIDQRDGAGAWLEPAPHDVGAPAPAPAGVPWWAWVLLGWSVLGKRRR